MRSLRLQLIATFAFCLLASFVASAITNELMENMYKRPYVDYTESMEQMDWETRQLASRIQENELQSQTDIVEHMNRAEEFAGVHMLIVDQDGRVLMKSSRSTESIVDLYSVISKAMQLRVGSSNQDWNGERQEFTSFYPVVLDGKKGYLIGHGIPEASIRYEEEFNTLVVIVFLVVFFYLFYWFTRRKTRYITELADSLLVISKGELKHRVTERGADELGSLSRNINQMAEALETNIERERKAEKTKNELITNVSHDLRTPLTSVIGYLRLLKDKPGGDAEQQEYTRIAYEKAEHLKRLVEDLFEYTTLNNREVPLYKQTLCLNELLEQLVEEYVPQAEKREMIFHKQLPAERVFVSIDPEKFVRVLENLLSNAIKYGSKPGSIDISLAREEENVHLVVANRANHLPREELGRLFERFYRVEQSRSQHTGGSGLGLAIVKSIVELHGGKIWAESADGVISFHITLQRATV